MSKKREAEGMSINEDHFRELLDKYANNLASPEETEDLYALIKDSNYDEALRQLLSATLEATDPILADEQLWDQQFDQLLDEAKNRESNKVQYIGWRRLAVAVCVLFVISVCGYFILHREKPPQVAQVQKHDIAPGRNQATLTLANGHQIILTKGLSGKLAQQGSTTISVNAGQAIAYQAANAETKATVEYNTLTTVRGEQSPYPLILADGTKAWLNAASSITFPTAFNGKDRIVKITGEVYFEVIHNEKQPFKVEAKGQAIEDIGTAFNVNAYNDEPQTRTTLISGVVEVNGHALKPGQAATGDHAIIKDADTEGAIAWKNNYFKFDHEDLSNTMRKISRWYNVEIVYPSGKPVTENYYGTMSRFSNLSKVLSKLEFIGAAKFKLEGNKVIVTQK